MGSLGFGGGLARMRLLISKRNIIKDKWRKKGITDKNTLNRIADKVMYNKGW